jgi:hypothetical protein
MLHIHRVVFGFYCVIFAYLPVGLFSSNTFTPVVDTDVSASILQYFNSIDEHTSLDEALDAIIYLRISLEAQQLSPPSISSLIEGTGRLLKAQGVHLNKTVLKEIESRLLRKELTSANAGYYNASFHLTKHTPDKNKNSNGNDFVEVSGKCIMGSVKVLAGGLICIIPNGYVRAAGITLMGSGVQDITEALVEKDKENVEREKKYGPPEPPPHFPRDFYEKKKMSCSITL